MKKWWRIFTLDWFYPWWWRYLFEPFIGASGLVERITIFWCRMRGHPYRWYVGRVNWYEPIYNCDNCGDEMSRG